MNLKLSILYVGIIGLFFISCSNENTSELFPDGTPVSDWFKDTSKISLASLGKQYSISEYGAVSDSNILQTNIIQSAIDAAANNGGGVIVIPKGVYLSGALFFKPNTSLYLAEGAVLKGSDTIANYPLIPSRMEGQCLDYYAALINAYGVDGFSISGKGTINGNGLKYWKAFWQRRKENPKCTNLEVSRPRLVFVRNSDNVQFQDVKMVNSGFWTNHFYKCNQVKLMDLHISSPHAPVKAPSTDAIDLDICSNVLIKGVYMSVNDDAIALKGGKGPTADKDTCNGMNSNILIEDCEFGFCHSMLTCGSEAIHNRNIYMRNCTVEDAHRMFWLKMREDTPQHYEYITLENIKGHANRFLCAKTWSQFFNLKGEADRKHTRSENITFKNIDLNCDVFYDVQTTDYSHLSNFTLENVTVEANKDTIDRSLIENIAFKNVVVNGKPVE